MHLLITGPTGYLGYNLCKSLAKTDIIVHAISRNAPPASRKVKSSNIFYYKLADIDIDKLIDINDIDGVIHCATSYGRDDDTLGTLQANLIFPLSILLKSIESKVQFFINTDTILDKRVNLYSLSKKQFLDWLYYFKSDINCFNLSLEHFYGPGDSVGKFTTFIIKELQNKTEYIDLTPGQQKRDFIYIDDVVSAFLCVINSVDKFEKGSIHDLQIGSGVNTSILDFVKLASKLTGNQDTKLNFGAIPYRDNEIMKAEVNLDMINLLGWKPKISLEEGLKKTIENELKK